MKRWMVATVLEALLVLAATARAQEPQGGAPPAPEQARPNAPGISSASDSAGRTEAAALARQAVENNPGLAVLEARIQALSQEVERAGAWSDPVAAVEYSNIPIDAGVLGEHPMSGLQLRLQQTVFFPGKLALRQQVARGEVRQEELLLAEKTLQLQALVQTAFYKLALVRQLRQVSEAHISLVSHFSDVARVKYEVGKVGQQDLLRLRVLRSRLEDELGDFDAQETQLLAQINGALSRPISRPVPTPARVEPPPPPRSAERLLELAQDERPLLALYRTQAETQRAAASAAAREGYPDLTIWVGYRVRLDSGADQGTDFFSAGLSLPIPLFYRQRHGSARLASLARARAAGASGHAALDQLAADLEAVLARWQRSYRKARAYGEQLVPEARQTLDATFAAYQVDRAQFADLYQAELQLLELERTIHQAKAAAAIARVETSALVGAEALPATSKDAGE